MFLTILVFIVMLSVLVLVHELGHFVLAKLFGIKVEEFGLGFPPRVWGKRIGETLYSINALPIGGFVKLYGEDEAGAGRVRPAAKSKKPAADLNRAFFAKPIWQRALVVVAGVAMNFLLAILIVTYLISTEGIPTNSHQVVIDQVSKNSPAALGGLVKGDLVLKVDNTDVTDPSQLVSQTRKHLGEKLTLEIKRDGKIQNLSVAPRKNYPEGEGPMGVAISQFVTYKKYPFPQSLYYGTKQTIDDSYQIVLGFKSVISDIVTRFTVPQGVAGPIGMAQLTGEFVKIGPTAVLSLVYMLSLSLAVINILPIPALDGGRFFFILVEALTRRKVNAKFEAYAHMVGIVVLLTFLALISYKDVLRILSGQSIFPQ